MATARATGVRRSPHTYDHVPLGPLVMLQEKAREHTTCSGRKLDTDTDLWNILHTSSAVSLYRYIITAP